ncbi:hypothetical protein N7462_010893 [Penicillium macrosclerotiorum]|uniref:uncharacterized protein n=1 Tax=Penicillium macrosclerotiorum TaxID=303699 RepID=UPI0025470C77|nr:uncharacterized protein N7462_010893 [Penicillium macrosclerotiorum]KAJ5669823.1 hypothetical protein N7462_010893 [Penicillium macrosclerotiorum]
MGICASCLGGSRQESPEVSLLLAVMATMFGANYLGFVREMWSAYRREQCLTIFCKPESSRLLEEDPYQAGYGYGALNHVQQQNQPDPEYVRREREALDAICQRTSDSVIDIWSLQPQPHLQPQATLHGPTSTTNSPTPGEGHSQLTVTSDQASETSRPASGCTVPKHWGEVVVNPNKKRSRPDMKADANASRDVFGVLKVT